MPYLDRFLELERGERLIRVVRRSKVILAMPVALAAFLLWLPLSFASSLVQFGFWGTALFLVLLALGILYSVRVLAIWYFNCFVITSQRLIDIDQQGLFHRSFSEAPLGKIQEVHFWQKGAVQAVCGHGTLEVQIEGTNVHLELRSIRRPKEVWELLNSLIKKYREGGIAATKERSYALASVGDQLGELSPEEIGDLVRELLRILSLARRRLGKADFRKILREK